MNGAVLHPGRLFHNGLVVASIDDAMKELERSLGLTFKGGWPAVHHLHYLGEDHDVELRIAFALQGPPYLELIEAKAGTIWPPESIGLHHMCYWSPEPELAKQALEDGGYTRLMGKPGDGGGYFRAPSGLIVEVLTPEYHQRLVAWLERGAKGGT